MAVVAVTASLVLTWGGTEAGVLAPCGQGGLQARSAERFAS